MKLVLFGIIYITLQVTSNPLNKNWNKEEENCLHELKLNKETIAEVTGQETLPEDNTDLNNFIACYWQNKTYQNKNGEINWDKMNIFFLDEFEMRFKEYPDLITLLAGEIVEDAVRKCHVKYVEPNVDHGKDVVKLRNCVKKTMQETFGNFEKLKGLSDNLFSKLFDF